MPKPCMRYRIPLVGNPKEDVALRSKYLAAFGSACYMSEAGTFDGFYQEWEDVCADAVKIAEPHGAAPYDKGYTCQPDGEDNDTLQVGPDPAARRRGLIFSRNRFSRNMPYVVCRSVSGDVASSCSGTSSANPAKTSRS
ncbi:hypothetical protein [Polyangium sp. 15x6]|uniref:hypothetical protein n=1 Tax=Polyangium sp. 15x6 TaxID=3042687 RepID=UPI00249BC6B7|nr:hypothetical protein [Polyangium sp. 15x6]MDI3285888.1 hypothetical protein [Polyangium sp. 15x6]